MIPRISSRLVALVSGGLALLFTSLSALQSTTGQEKKGKEFVGTPIVDANLNLVASVRGQQASIAEPLPSDVASAIGRPAGSTVLGRW